MARIELCVDENVPDAYVTVLRSNGFTVIRAVAEHGKGTIDEELLEWCGENRYVLLTNDRDFVELDETATHAGLIVFTSQTLTPGEVATALRRVDRQYTPEALDNGLIWLDNWL